MAKILVTGQVLVLGGAVLLASAIPAGRAVRIDPIKTINQGAD